MEKDKKPSGGVVHLACDEEGIDFGQSWVEPPDEDAGPLIPVYYDELIDKRLEDGDVRVLYAIRAGRVEGKTDSPELMKFVAENLKITEIELANRMNRLRKTEYLDR